MKSKWLWIGIAIVAAAAAIAYGVPLSTVLLVGLVLLCPAVMYFAMSGSKKPQEPERDHTDKS